MRDLEEVTDSFTVTLEQGGSGERTPWLTITLALTPWVSAVGSRHLASLLVQGFFSSALRVHREGWLLVSLGACGLWRAVSHVRLALGLAWEGLSHRRQWRSPVCVAGRAACEWSSSDGVLPELCMR